VVVSFKLAGVFSLCLSTMLVAVFVYHAEERLVLFQNQRDGFPAIVNWCF